MNLNVLFISAEEQWISLNTIIQQIFKILGCLCINMSIPYFQVYQYAISQSAESFCISTENQRKCK